MKFKGMNMSKSILIVEDERIVAKEIELTLKNLGYSVSGTESSGEEAVKSAIEKRPDLVLMDIKLRGKMDGTEAARRIYSKAGIPAVFLTAYSDETVVRKASKALALGYVTKPFSERHLRAAIEVAFSKQEEMEGRESKDESSHLDLYDRKILGHVLENCRASVSEIGKGVRLSKRAVSYRLKRLVDDGYVRRFYALVNNYMLGYRYYMVRLEFRNTGQDTEKLVLEHLRREPGVMRACVTEGSFGLVLFTVQRDEAQLRSFLDRFNTAFGGYVHAKSLSGVTRMHVFGHGMSAGDRRPFFPKITIGDTGAGCDVDGVDLSIARLLASDARTGLLDMAKKLNLGWKSVKHRIKKMEKKGVFPAYTAELSPRKLGFGVVHLSISVKDLSSLPSVVEFFGQSGYGASVYETLGENDLLVELHVQGQDELRKTLADMDRRFPGGFLSYGVCHMSSSELINPTPVA